jgi:hypothetical protein
MEAVALHIFHGFPSLPRFDTSESLLDNSYSMRTLSASSFGEFPDLQDEVVPPDQKQTEDFTHFFHDLFASLKQILPLRRSLPSPDIFSRLVRIFHWIVLRIQPCTVDHLDTFFEFLKQSQTWVPAPNCTSVEILRLFGSVQEPLKTSFLTNRFRDFVSVIFPIDFGEYPRFSKALLLRLFSLFRKLVVLSEILQIESIVVSIKKFFRLIDDSGARKLVKYLAAWLTGDNEWQLLNVVLDELRDNSLPAANLLLISTVLPFVENSITDEIFTFIVEWLLAEIGASSSDHEFVNRIAAACLRLADLDRTLTRTEVFRAKLPSVIRFMLTPCAGHHGQAAIREGLRTFLHHFGQKDISINLCVLDSIIDCLDEEVEITNQTFWPLQHLFCSCLVLLPSRELRAERIEREFSKMLDFLEPASFLDFEKCFSFLIRLIRMDGYKAHETWASVMYCLLMGTPLLWDGVKEFLIVVIESATDDWGIERFMEYVAEMKAKEPSEFDEVVEKAALFLQAKPLLREKMLQLAQVDPALFKTWPRQPLSLLPLHRTVNDCKE